MNAQGATAIRLREESPGFRGSGSSTGRVVVGVDGSPASVAALRWAFRTAANHGWTLDVVTAWPDPEDVFVHEVPGHYCAPRGRAVAEQHKALAAAEARASDVTELRTFIDNAHPAEALAARGVDASVIVVGAPAHAHPRTHRLPVGEGCALLAACPVVVVDDPSSPTQDSS